MIECLQVFADTFFVKKVLDFWKVIYYNSKNRSEK